MHDVDGTGVHVCGQSRRPREPACGDCEGCYTENAKNAWHRPGTQKTVNTYTLQSTQTTVNCHTSQTKHQALSKEQPRYQDAYHHPAQQSCTSLAQQPPDIITYTQQGHHQILSANAACCETQAG